MPLHLTTKQLSDYQKKIEVTPSGCLIWTASTMKTGYGQFNVNGKMMGAHRIAWELANGPIPEGMCVLHNCPSGDNRLCVNHEHLFLGTRAENSRDMINKGRSGTGQRNSQAKLTEDDVRGIRKSCECGESKSSVARRYGISRTQVSNTVARKRWAHVK